MSGPLPSQRPLPGLAIARDHREVHRAARRVIDRVRFPSDSWATLATLEADGVRDAEARRYGFRNLEDFARNVHDVALALVGHSPYVAPKPPAPPGARALLRNLATGAAFTLPMAVQAAFLGLTGYSLWGASSFSDAESASVALATVLSLVLSGAPVTLIGRACSGHVQSGDALALRDALREVLGVSALLVAGGLAAAAGCLAMTGWLPASRAAMVLAYAAAQAIVWVAIAVHDALRMRLRAAAATGLATAGVCLASAQFAVPVQLAHLVAMGGCGAVMLALAVRHVALRARRGRAAPPALRGLPADVRLASWLPFAAYGACYFALLMVDRLPLWSRLGVGPEPLRFDAEYEVAMLLALGGAIAAMSYLEHFAQASSAWLAGAGLRWPLARVADLRAAFAGFLARSALTLGALGALGLVLIAALAHGFAAAAPGHAFSRAWHAPGLVPLYLLAGVSYVMLAESVMLTTVLFRLAFERLVLRGLAHALGAGLVAAFFASRLLAPRAAAFGLFAGALSFLLSLVTASRRVLRQLDHAEFAAF